MVKRRKKGNTKRGNLKGFKKNRTKAIKIKASTAFESCTEHLCPFGGLLALIKFFDLIRFEEVLNSAYIRPKRKPRLDDYKTL